MSLGIIPPARDFAVPTARSDALMLDDDCLPGTEDWAVLESLRSREPMSAEERDAEDERVIALMVGGDAFD
jgi:hypothetical protein